MGAGTLTARTGVRGVLLGISSGFPELSPTQRQVICVLLTLSPLNPKVAFDLHVLGTPPAFALSQDQTLHDFINNFGYLLLELTELVNARACLTGSFLVRSLNGCGYSLVKELMRQKKRFVQRLHQAIREEHVSRTLRQVYQTRRRCQAFSSRKIQLLSVRR